MTTRLDPIYPNHLRLLRLTITFGGECAPVRLRRIVGKPIGHELQALRVRGLIEHWTDIVRVTEAGRECVEKGDHMAGDFLA
jgi:hypothetical protein